MAVILPREYPRYIFNPGEIFPSVPSTNQNTSNTTSPLGAMVLAVAYLLRGKRFPGAAGTLDNETIEKELRTGCDAVGASFGFLVQCAKSVLMPPSVHPPAELLGAVSPYIASKKFSLTNYQLVRAGWSGIRRGSILDFGCGVGKTASAIVALRVALKAGICRPTRIIIVAPVNAIGTWQAHKQDLCELATEVMILSVNSMHKYDGIDGTAGGALIIDEVHRGSGSDTNGNATRCRNGLLKLRGKVDWAICLTATLLHSGPMVMLNAQELALPGLSRVIDPWAFGDAFECIALTDVPQTGGRKVKKPKLVRPPEHRIQDVARYLEWGAISLSFDSPEVMTETQVPPQTLFTVDDWPDLVLPEGAIDPRTTGWQEYMGALGGAMMVEGQEAVVRYVAQLNGNDASPSIARAWLEEAINDPFFPGDPRVAAQLLREGGPPNFSRLCYAMCREGRFDRWIIRGAPGELPRFWYAPGSTPECPAPGPKLQFVQQWLLENPDESLVLGAGGKGTVACAERMLTAMGVTFATIRGGVPAADRARFESMFQAGEIRVLLAQEVAGSESLTLIRAANSMLIDHDWKPIPYSQFLGRTRRQGQTRETSHIDLVFNVPQRKALTTIRAGREFDAQVRNDMEAAYHARPQSTITIAPSRITLSSGPVPPPPPPPGP